MKKVIRISSMAVLLAAGNAYAATNANLTITGVGCDQGGSCYANVTPPVSTTCSNPNQVRWSISDVSGKNWLASALTAKAAGIKVTVGTVDGSCAGSFAKVNFITVK